MKNALVFSQLILSYFIFYLFYIFIFYFRNHVRVGINTLCINPFAEGFFEYLLFKDEIRHEFFIVVLLGDISFIIC